MLPTRAPPRESSRRSRTRGATRTARARSSEPALALREALFEQERDLVLHARDVTPDGHVVVVRVTLQADRLAEVQAVLHRQRQEAQQPEPRKEPSDWERRRADDSRECLGVDESGALLLGPDDPDRHDRRLGLQREPHEPCAEALQLVSLAERLDE